MKLTITVHNLHQTVTDPLKTASVQVAIRKCVTSTPLKKKSHSGINIFSKVKVLCVNCQSLQKAEKQARCYALLEQHDPDIVVGTESRLHKDILDSEVFPSSLGFNPQIRRDRPPGIKSKGGGVIILVSQRLIVTEQPQLATDCEIPWARVHVIGAKPLLIAAYYRQPDEDQASAEELEKL